MLKIKTQFATATLLVVALVATAPAPAHAQEWKLGVKLFPVTGGGVRIAEVIPNSPAAEIGLKPGNVILVLGGKLVNKPEEARDKIFSAGSEIDIIYQDGGDFYQITSPLVSVAYAVVQNGKTLQKQKLVPSKPVRKRVSDPRKRVSDPRKK